MLPATLHQKIFQLKNQQVKATSLLVLSFHWITKLNYQELKEVLPEIILLKGEISSLSKGFKEMKTKLKQTQGACYFLFKANNKGVS